MTPIQLEELTDESLVQLIDAGIKEIARRVNMVDSKIKKSLSTADGLDEAIKFFIPTEKFIPISDVAESVGRYFGEREASPKNVMASLERLFKNGDIQKNVKFVKRNC